MLNLHRLPLLFTLLACCVSMSVAAADVKGFPVAVLDLEEVFNTAKTFAARKEAIQQQGNEAQAQIKKNEETERSLRNKLGLLAPGGPDHLATIEELELLKVKQKLLLDRIRSSLEKAQVELLRTATGEVKAALDLYTRETGWKIVLLKNNNEIGRGGLQETQIQLGMQSVLSVDPDHDITASFIAWLNARAAAETAPKPE